MAVAASRYRVQRGAAVQPHDFHLKDQRYDPLVGLALRAVSDVVKTCGGSMPESTGILTVTNSGCRSHIARVSEAMLDGKPRQAFFARGGPNMISTYISIALQTHGPALSFLGRADAVVWGMQSISDQIDSGTTQSWLLVGADYLEAELVAGCIYFDKKDGREIMISIEEIARSEPGLTPGEVLTRL
ncbi:hypothetical protein NDK50_34975 [Paraburkholderia bryophila]|uniref:hypothetical protein n=1 Tax=Paraburkholderia bryophila TaxID=420952 RepID=UPI00234B8B1D|nr:hypothetical protein [Paraburkholderia bryophila]WCM23156.1 hypothetical protein NDK50_34975 [Paraburkholderia bryophila]